MVLKMTSSPAIRVMARRKCLCTHLVLQERSELFFNRNITMNHGYLRLRDSAAFRRQEAPPQQDGTNARWSLLI